MSTPREARLSGETILVLREPKPVQEKIEPHHCVVDHGDRATKSDSGSIIQCSCGRRYRSRRSILYVSNNKNDPKVYVWVRRILPWPPKQPFPY